MAPPWPDCDAGNPTAESNADDDDDDDESELAPPATAAKLERAGMSASEAAGGTSLASSGFGRSSRTWAWSKEATCEAALSAMGQLSEQAAFSWKEQFQKRVACADEKGILGEDGDVDDEDAAEET